MVSSLLHDHELLAREHENLHSTVLFSSEHIQQINLRFFKVFQTNELNIMIFCSRTKQLQNAIFRWINLCSVMDRRQLELRTYWEQRAKFLQEKSVLDPWINTSLDSVQVQFLCSFYSILIQQSFKLQDSSRSENFFKFVQDESFSLSQGLERLRCVNEELEEKEKNLNLLSSVYSSLGEITIIQENIKLGGFKRTFQEEQMVLPLKQIYDSIV